MSETTNQNGPSLEIDVDAIARMAAELDSVADAPVVPKKKRKWVAKTPASSADVSKLPDETPEEVPAPIDPEFEAMLIHGASQGIDLMRDKLDLMDPGDTMRENVGKCLARLVTRLKPMKEGPLSDAVTIAGYLGVWALCGRDWTKKPTPKVVTGQPYNPGAGFTVPSPNN